ncbi:hypothetical protein V6N13_122513 [Hibiscus sabdariffa]
MWPEVSQLVHCTGAFHHSRRFHKPVANLSQTCNLSVPKSVHSTTMVPLTAVRPGGRQNPPSAITGQPVFGAVAGHIGKGHLLCT